MCDFVGTPLNGLELQPMVDYINGLHAGGRRAAPAAPRGHRQRRAEGPEDRSGRISRVAPAGRSGQRSNFRNFRNRPSASGGGAEVNSAWIIRTRAVSAVWRTRRERSCRPGSRQAARGVGSRHSRGRDPHAATAHPRRVQAQLGLTSDPRASRDARLIINGRHRAGSGLAKLSGNTRTGIQSPTNTCSSATLRGASLRRL